MERKWIWKLVFVLLLVAFAFTASAPTVLKSKKSKDGSDNPNFLQKMFPGISLGLDLQGGLRLIYEVEVDVAIEDKRDNVAEAIVNELKKEAGIKKIKMQRGDDFNKFDLVFASDNARQSNKVREVLKDFRQSAIVEMEEKNISHMILKEEVVNYTRDLSVKQAIETIGNRIDELGLVNTSVVPRGQDIIVEVPGVGEKQITRIKNIISTTARLEFKIVDEEGSKDFFMGLADKLPKNDSIKLQKENVRNGESGMIWSYYLEAKDKHGGKNGKKIILDFLATTQIPDDRQIGFEKNQALDDTGAPTADVSWRTYFMERKAGITGEYVDNAMVLNDESTGQPYISLDFNPAGAKKFAELTEANVKRRMAIKLDEKIYSAPTIQEKIPGGRARITLGGFESYQKLFRDAENLVIVLRAGALPAPLKPINETTVGPALGADSIAMGKLSLIIGGLAVILFMIMYYKMGGIAASVALLANALFITGILSGFGATLTLPGIAGIILTIGMAVDANVIIYERIREELKSGKSPFLAVDTGYKRAFWTIFDAQVTTFIAGVVLLQYGTGAIKGFAVTLLIGIATSMFSAIFISRLFFDWMIRRKAQHLSI